MLPVEKMEIDWTEAYSRVTGWVSKSIQAQDVKDVAQDVMVQAALSMSRPSAQFLEQSQFSSWLWVITRNTVASHLRRSEVELPHFDVQGETKEVELADVEPVSEVDLTRELQSDEALAVVMTLSPKYKEVLYYHYWLGMGFADMERNRGRRFPITQNAYKNRHERAIEAYGEARARSYADVTKTKKLQSDIEKIKKLKVEICRLPDCDGVFIQSWLGGRQEYCTLSCAQKASRRKSDPSAFGERECALDGCDAVFTPVPKSLQEYCSPRHRQTAYYRRKEMNTVGDTSECDTNDTE